MNLKHTIFALLTTPALALAHPGHPGHQHTAEGDIVTGSHPVLAAALLICLTVTLFASPRKARVVAGIGTAIALLGCVL